ncbi:hypothetical protein K437DRAFT_226713 [Tilletiaria anomala UBC 951]|uniref:Yeast cell wall synthesis Kre9/Knh1-like N-terminal domain-containing protein n=1 Tax=Tilletiaria anomala (strain ATCC 24038 / CBS 436.72 / UBC 951) TaxID=1037660 RepID=A0A066VIE7_TILAU|nr:uncharacterized protein K437DRAFT_226713 [Tilletiaria anomala UBC 951]KDN41512.1 hypothetical protein K437DRAFT_226713 [Tilletiaria anomala UBC 951]
MLHKRQSTSSTSSGLVLTGPGPGETFRAGGTCTVTWTPDTSGSTKWKSFTLDLNTGSNQAMTKLETIATGLDGTDPTKTSYSWTCPEVSPYSAIYFYQVTTDGTSDPAWTTRWAISSPNGTVVSPPHANQPGGGSPAIPWGNGKLLSAPVTNSASTGASSSAASSSSSSSSSSSTAAVAVPSIVGVASSPSTTSSPAASSAPSTVLRGGASSRASAGTGAAALLAVAAGALLI